MPIASIEEALAAAGVMPVAPAEAEALDRDGYLMLRGLVARGLVLALRERFERAVKPSEEWPYPRESDIRYAQLDKDEEFLRICLAPRALAAAHHLFKRRFFMASFEGRDPREGGGAQNLHRDCLEPAGEAKDVTLLAFLDSFGPSNGATRVIPGSHAMNEPLPYRDPREVVLEGEAGDAVLFNARLIHSGTRNGGPGCRRTLIVAYKGHEGYASRYYKLEAPDGATESVRYLLGEA